MKILLFIIMSLPTASAQAGMLSAEKNYLQTRDADIAQMAQLAKTADDKTLDAQTKRYFKELEKQLNAIIVSRGGQQGTINLETLIREGGFNMVDGLLYGKPDRQIFATTKNLLAAYLAASKIKTDLSVPEADDNLYSLIFDWDSAFYTYSRIPLDNIPDGWKVSALLMLNSQDTGPFVPHDIVILAETRGGMVLAAHLSDIKGTRQSLECKTQWEELENKTDRITNNDERLKDGDRNFDAYRKCFINSLNKNKNAFQPLQNQAVRVLKQMEELFN